MRTSRRPVLELDICAAARILALLMDISYLATLARLHLNGEEAAIYGHQLDGILHYMHVLDSADLSGVELDHSACFLPSLLREDAARPGLEREDFLPNAPKRNDEQFIVPKVIE